MQLIDNHPNFRRGKILLERINTPDDLVTLWKKFGSYQIGNSPEYLQSPWWVNLPGM